MKRHRHWPTFNHPPIRWVFGNRFEITTGYDRQWQRARQRWRFEPGLRWLMFRQRRRGR